jgi:multidrug efflux system membrane fusion protein
MKAPSRTTVRCATAMAAVLVLMGCGQEATAPDRPSVVRPVKTLVVGTGGGDRLAFPGTVQAAKRAELSFRVSGPLIELPVNEGDRVSAEQLLGRIDPRDFEISVAEATAEAGKTEADYQRYQRLYEKDAVPLSDVELRRAQRDMSAARLEQAQQNLLYTHLVAPFPGRIGRRFIENFEVVQAQQPIVTLHQINRVEIVIDVPESLMANVREGAALKLSAMFDSHRDRPFPLTFKEASAEADPQTQTFQVTLAMPQPGELRVLPGMTAQVVVQFGTEGGDDDFAVPAVSVFAGLDGGSRVWVVDPQALTVNERSVSVGEVTGDKEIWIREGLEPGEMIAVTAVHRLREGMKIRPLESRVGATEGGASR